MGDAREFCFLLFNVKQGHLVIKFAVRRHDLSLGCLYLRPWLFEGVEGVLPRAITRGWQDLI